MPTARHPVVGTLALLEGAVVLVTVFRVLPARVFAVDLAFGVLGVLLILAGLGLGVRTRWGRPVALVVLGSTLLAGMSTVAMLAFAAGEVVGLYGPVGHGVSVLLVFAFLLVTPYLVWLPAAQLWFLLARRNDARPT